MEIVIMSYNKRTHMCICICEDKKTRIINPFAFCFPGVNGEDLEMKRFKLPDTVDINPDDIITPRKGEMTEVNTRRINE